MSDQRDRVDIDGIGDGTGNGRGPRNAKSAPRPFLMRHEEAEHEGLLRGPFEGGLGSFLFHRGSLTE
jgi:hypothetical protein